MSTAVQLINDWVRQNALPINLPWQGPRASITFDSVRVHLNLIAGGVILAEARICDLPGDSTGLDRVLFRLTGVSLARMGENAAVLSVDTDGAACWLQRRLSATMPVYEFGDAVEALVNEVELWRAAL